MNFDGFIHDIRSILPEGRICTDEMRSKVLAVDASPYAPLCRAVLDIESTDEMAAVLASGARHGVSLTIRGAGTALSGQSIAEDVLLRLAGSRWHGIEILDGGMAVRARCRTTGGEINAALLPSGRMLASDPSSIGIASIGGMAANNAAGLSCTVEHNIFHMLEAMEFMLADGTLVDTADEESLARFRRSHSSLLEELSALRTELLSRGGLHEKVCRKFGIRNTCGYSLNALADFDDPLDILSHLLIGSEGTLGFIVSVTLRTVPLEPLRGTAMVAFRSLSDSMHAVVEIQKECSLYACEFIDDITLRGIAHLPGFPKEFVPEGESSDVCVLLLEARSSSMEELERIMASVEAIVRKYDIKNDPSFVTDPEACERLWDIRRALLPASASTRLPSEYAFTEDYCVPLENLPEACHAFADIFSRLGFVRSGVTGHAWHGNLHCIIPLDLGDEEELGKLAIFIEEAAHTVLRLNGSLKAEHGTGRAMAPFVRREWGDELYGMMRRIKDTLDPAGILNRGTIFTDDPESHMKGVKIILPAGHGLDLCMDCGFCESVCPTARIGFSPRQLIYALRAAGGFHRIGDDAKSERWRRQFVKENLPLCATDGLCSTRCPLGIDTAGAVRAMRGEQHTERQDSLAGTVGSHIGAAVSSASFVLDTVSLVHRSMGGIGMSISGAVARRMTGMSIPDFRRAFLAGSSPVPAASRSGGDKVVYFPSCAVRSMGYTLEQGRKADPLMDTVLRLLEKAGYEAVIPEDVNSLCCGKAFDTKGFGKQARVMAERLGKALLEASDNGRIPVLCDTSPCLDFMKKTLDSRLKLYEPVEFTLVFLAGRLEFFRKHRCVAVHPTCSTRAMGLAEKMRQVAALCSEKVVMPSGIFCCGFSGDKGFTHPELNAAALSGLAAATAECEAGYSTSRTCEIGLSVHGGKKYSNILYLIDECTEGKSFEA